MAYDLDIVEPDPAWPRAFAAERARLAAAVLGAVAIEHMGSTAVPDLPAKPIIDVLVGVDEPALVDTSGEEPWTAASTHSLLPAGDPRHVAFVRAMTGLGYVYRGLAEIPGRLFFRRDEGGRRAQHVHVAAVGGSFWTSHLLFRDYLRAHPERAAAYGRLKRELVQQVEDRAAYTDAKGPFIRAVLADAAAWRAR